MDLGQGAVALAGRSPYGVDDDCGTHGSNLQMNPDRDSIAAPDGDSNDQVGALYIWVVDPDDPFGTRSYLQVTDPRRRAQQVGGRPRPGRAFDSPQVAAVFAFST
jgi:hypothetical protein